MESVAEILCVEGTKDCRPLRAHEQFESLLVGAVYDFLSLPNQNLSQFCKAIKITLQNLKH